MQIVALPAGWKLAVVRGEEIGAQLVLVLEAAPLTFVVIGVAAAPQTGDILDVGQRKPLPAIRLGAGDQDVSLLLPGGDFEGALPEVGVLEGCRQAWELFSQSWLPP